MRRSRCGNARNSRGSPLRWAAAAGGAWSRPATTRRASSASTQRCRDSKRGSDARTWSSFPCVSIYTARIGPGYGEILLSYTPLVEPLSLDEAYLDVTGLDRYAWDIAREIRKRIFEETRLTASAGIAPNKMLAKIASDWRKPNGQFAITPDQVDAFVHDLPVRKLWGVGPKSAEKFEQHGIRTCGDLQKIALPQLALRHGKWGHELYQLCRGQDERAVEPNRIRKSLSNECTYTDNLRTLEECRHELDKLILELEQELCAKASDRQIHKALVKVKFADFTRTTRECISPNPSREVYHALLAEAYERSPQPIRLLGAGVRFAEEGKKVEESEQQELFTATHEA